MGRERVAASSASAAPASAERARRALADAPAASALSGCVDRASDARATRANEGARERRLTTRRRATTTRRRFGFGGYAGQVSLTARAASDASADAGEVDEDAARALRRCAQKSSTATKAKALRELRDALFVDAADEDSMEEVAKKVKTVAGVLGVSRAWARAYDKLAGDGDAGCRREAAALNGAIAVAAGKGLGKILKSTPIMCAWVRGMCDPNAEVREMAMVAFEKTFSTDARRAGALALAHEVILDDLIEALKRRGPQDMIFKEGSEAEQYARFELSARAALRAVTFTCERLSAFEGDESDAAASKFSYLLDELATLKTQIRGEYMVIRRDAYATLAAICKRAVDDEITPAWRDALRGQVPKIASTSFALISSETEPGAMRDMWELILGIATSHPDAWGAIDVEKTFMSGLRKHFKRGSYGAASVSSPSLLPLLAHLPPKALIERDADGRAMSGLVRVMDAVFAGWCFLSSSAVRSNEARDTLPAMREGVLYGVLKLAPLTDHAEECATHVLVDHVVDVWMREFLARGNGAALDLMCDVLNVLSTKPHAKTAVVEAWAKLGDITEAALDDPEKGEHANAMYARLFASGKFASSSQATAPFAKAVFAQAVDAPSKQTFERLATLVESLGVEPFDGAQRLMDFALADNAPQGSGAVVAAVLKHDASWWSAVLDDANAADELESSSRVRVVTEAIAATKSFGELKCPALDDLVRRCAKRSSDASCSQLLIAISQFFEPVSADVASDVFESLASSDLGDGASNARKALREWILIPPKEALSIPWSNAVGALFAHVLLESQHTVKCVIHEAESEGESEDEVEYDETKVGEVQRDWKAFECDAESNPVLSPALQAAFTTAIARTAAATAATQHPGESDLVLRLWAQMTARALRAFHVDDETFAKCIVDEMENNVDDDVTFHWLNAVARVLDWSSLLRAMDADRRKEFTVDALALAPSVNKAFAIALCGDAAMQTQIFVSLVNAVLEASPDDESAEDALLNFSRRARALDEAWIDNHADVVREFLDASSAKRDTCSNRLTRVIPWILPSDMSGGAHAERFIAELTREVIADIENRRRRLDGAKIRLVAACFSRADDLGETIVVHSIQDPACAPLVEVFRAIAKREAAEAAASAAAARFGDAGDSESRDGSSASDVGIAALTAAIIRRTAADFDSRDWGSIIGRLHAWTALRAKMAETYAENEAVDGDDGSQSAHAAATIVCLIDALPMELLEATDSSSGDLVPYAAHGSSMMTIAKALANASWPRERAEIVERLYRCVIITGTELRDVEEEDDDERRHRFWARCRDETRMWIRIADIACGGTPTKTSAWRAGVYVDAWDDAPCESIGALYQLLAMLPTLWFDVSAADDDEVLEALRRAAYGLLSNEALIQAAVVGLDAGIADVAKVEQALDAALAAADENDEADVGNFGTPAESAGLREDLATLLSSAGYEPRVAWLGWALLFRYVLALPIESSCRERLVNYTRETKAIPSLMRDIMRSMPLPESADVESEDDLPSSWRGVDWDNPASATQIYDPRFSFEVLMYAAALRALPASVRAFVSDMKPQRDVKRLEGATSVTVSPTLIAAEFKAVSAMTFAGDGTGSLTVKPSIATREVLTTYEIDESSLELTVRLPNAYPLAPAELVCAKRVGISEARLRKWMLGISAILKHQNGAVAQALLQWQRNIDAEFAGVEPCPICYAVIHPVDHQKPRLRCRQCSNTFHATCLYTWFRTSSKSSCPLCVTPWGSSYR
jgi:hypothetical protein